MNAIGSRFATKLCRVATKGVDYALLVPGKDCPRHWSRWDVALHGRRVLSKALGGEWLVACRESDEPGVFEVVAERDAEDWT